MMTPTVAAETKMSVNLCMDTGKSKILNIFWKLNKKNSYIFSNKEHFYIQ
jgi:hypothetical protein